MEEMEDRHDIKDFIKSIPFQPSICKTPFIEKIKRREPIGVVDCSLQVPEEKYLYFEGFSPLSKIVKLNEMAHTKFAERKKLLPRPRKCWFLASNLSKYQLSRHFCYYIWKKFDPPRCFETFVQNLVDARREGNQTTEWTVVAETMKFIRNGLHGYQIMNRSHHTNTQNWSDLRFIDSTE